jgi:peptidoglycan hydrolase CwlO-like protein
MVAALALLCALCVPLSTAHAVTSAQLASELEDARAHLSTLYQEHDQAISKLRDTKKKLAKANGDMDALAEQLATTHAELDRAQDVLAYRVSSDYKSGGISFLGIILQSESFEELISNLYYVGKLIEHDQEVIRAVKVARKKLNKRESELIVLQERYTDLLKQQKEQLSELENSKEEEQAYVESLSAEVQRVMEKELAEEQARRQREDKARKKADEEARKKAEEEARLEEEARRQAEEDARKKAEEEEAARAAEEDQKAQEQEQQKEDPEPAPDDSQDKDDADTTKAQKDGNDDQDNESGESEESVPSGSSTDADYAAWRASWISGNITSGMSTMDKVNALYTMISSFSYDRTYRNFTAYNMYLNGCGTCRSSSEMVLDFCADLGIPAEYRWASPGDPGYSSNPDMNHRNDYVWIDGVRYIVEANPGTYGSIRPRQG